jgi:hypothetical protein
MSASSQTTRNRGILAGLVCVHVVLHVIVLVLFLNRVMGPPGGPYDFILYPLFMLGPSQGALLAMWIVLGAGKFVWRILPTFVGTIVYLWLFGHADREWIPLMFGNLGSVFVFLCLSRIAGLSLLRATADSRRLGPTQFYIRDLLIWTTALAVVLSISRSLPVGWYRAVSAPMPNALTIFGCILFVSLTSIFSALGTRWLIARIAMTPLSVWLGAYLMVAAHVGFPSVAYFSLLLGLMAGWIVGSLLLIRLTGYRLTWKWRWSGAAANVPQEADQGGDASEVNVTPTTD